MVATTTINKFWDHVTIVDVKAARRSLLRSMADIKKLEVERCENCNQNKRFLQMLLKMKVHGPMKKN
jgi:hypothetical protein